MTRTPPLAALVVLLLGACTHDLEALSAGGSKTQLRDASSSMTSTLTDAGGGNRDAGTDGATPSGGACQPCSEVPDAGAALGLSSCCRGVANTECGLTFGSGGLCLPRNATGVSDQVCPSVRVGAMMAEGCCRPDSKCGIAAPMFDLGCVPREQILLQLGAPKADPLACHYPCTVDADCGPDGGGLKCIADPKDTTHMAHFCVTECGRDQDCEKGHVCALGNDVPNDRVIAYCQPPVGSVQPGDYCSAAQDCSSGVCLKLTSDMTPACSQICKNSNDCAMGKTCFASTIQSPAKDKTQMFRICGPASAAH